MRSFVRSCNKNSIKVYFCVNNENEAEDESQESDLEKDTQSDDRKKGPEHKHFDDPRL